MLSYRVLVCVIRILVLIPYITLINKNWRSRHNRHTRWMVIQVWRLIFCFWVEVFNNLNDPGPIPPTYFIRGILIPLRAPDRAPQISYRSACLCLNTYPPFTLCLFYRISSYCQPIEITSSPTSPSKPTAHWPTLFVYLLPPAEAFHLPTTLYLPQSAL